LEVFGVIMAGGGGTRFWPLSRREKPKQLLNISGSDALVNETINRMSLLIDKKNIIIVTNEKHDEGLKEVVVESSIKNNILLEPDARNTAACIGYAAFEIYKKYGDAVMCVFPSDHYIKDEVEFQKVLKETIRVAETSEKLVTIGIRPTFNSTGYGYIKFQLLDGSDYSGKVYEVAEFIEKPTFETAKRYVESGQYLWNSGMFAWKVSVILDNFKRFLPKIYDKLEKIFSYYGSSEEEEKLQEIYPTIQSISIDYGIMERSNDVLVLPGDFGWSDVGSWDSLGAIYPKDDMGNIVKGEHVKIDTKNSIIYANDRLITTVGISNTIVVETEDAVLVCRKDKAQDVRAVVDILKGNGMDQYL
jgi:mannose-1-phosphate guanylyltransferase